MGWLSDLWKKIVSHIASAIRATIYYIQKVIELARVIINIAKYKIRMKIAGWLQDDTATILLCIAIVVGAIFLSLVGHSAWFVALLVKIRVMKADFKNREQSIEGIIAFQVAYATHRISLVFFPEYQKMIGDLRVSVSAFMEVIGEPVRTASILLESGRALVYAGYTLVGMEDNYKEAVWLSGVQTWLNQTGQRIGRYTRNPELIFQDIWDEVIQPNLEIPNTAMGTIYTTLHNLSDGAVRFTDNLDTFRNRLDDFTEAMPEEIQALVESRLSPVTDKVDMILDDYLIPYTEKTDAAFSIIDGIILDNENKIVKLAEKTDDPLYLLELIDKLSGDIRESALRLLSLLTAEKEYREKGKVFAIIDREYSAEMKLQEKRIKEAIIEHIPISIQPGRSVKISDVTFSKDSWFVGEH